MSDLISRQAAIEALEFGITYAKAVNRETGEATELFKQSNDELKKAIERIQKLPTVDTVEVVRCKDCKHRPVMVWSEVYDDLDVLAPEVDGKEDWRCPCLVEDDPYYSWSPNDNWFCASGERRENNADAEGKG